MQASAHTPALIRRAGRARSVTSVAGRYAFAALVIVVGLYAGLPWLAPVLMHLGWTAPAKAIYTFYSTQCHQMAQRSYFLFGPAIMLSPADLAAAGVQFDPLSLRAFLGNSELGWKLAWSDRMTAMYTSLFVFLVLSGLPGKRLKPLPAWALLLLLVPMAVDGGTHLLSDLSGFGQGLRDWNVWLADLTGGRFRADFYAGDAWGSFNATLRLVTGILFGLGLAWFAAPRIGGWLQGVAEGEAQQRRRAEAQAAPYGSCDSVYNSSLGGDRAAGELLDRPRELPWVPDAAPSDGGERDGDRSGLWDGSG